MQLPVQPPVSPMLAKISADLPDQPGMYFEPKWDGFRCVVFRDGAEVELGSRNERSLLRYFPELPEPLRAQLPPRCVLDGELVVAGAQGLDFEALLQRIHPAASRVRKLALDTPAAFVAFDLLALGDRDLRDQPFSERRKLLEAVLRDARPPLHLTPCTQDRAVAARWFAEFEGAGLDGVIAKAADLPYLPGERVMWKIKHERTADCVVAGFRTHKDGRGPGSLLLGLYDDAGVLHHVGVASGFSAADRARLAQELQPLQQGATVGHPWAGKDDDGTQRLPGGESRFSQGKDLSWLPLRIERVAEVRYDHLQGTRFRHATHFVRWRPDRDPESCTYAQLDTPVPHELRGVFGA